MTEPTIEKKPRTRSMGKLAWYRCFHKGDFLAESGMGRVGSQPADGFPDQRAAALWLADESHSIPDGNYQLVREVAFIEIKTEMVSKRNVLGL